MIVARENDEIVIRIPDAENRIELFELQRIIEYINYCLIVKKSKASQEQIDELAREVNTSWWNENFLRMPYI